MKTEIRTVRYRNGEIQRCQVVSGFEWSDLEFVRPAFSKETFRETARIYREFVLKKHPDFYGAMVIFHIPDYIETPLDGEQEAGLIFDRNLAAAAAMEKLAGQHGIYRTDNALTVEDPAVSAFLDRLEADGWLYIWYGRKDNVSFFPVGDATGYLGSLDPCPHFACNANFFEMDLFDRDSPYDLFGTPYGMVVKDGVMAQPPLHNRETLIVNRGQQPRISRVNLHSIAMTIREKTFLHGENCTVYWRPDTRTTPAEEGLDLVIVGDRVAAMHEGGNVRVPMCGFVLHTSENLEREPSKVIYRGFEDCIFGIQTGSSVVRDSTLMRTFQSPFYDIYNREEVPFPPTLYPLDYEKDRAPRMAICSDREGKPVIVWAEGASKLSYRPGEESCGTSLLELGEFCKSIGLVNALNLDGGGSAEIFIDGKLHMHVSGRNMDNSDAERPVPMGLMIR